MLRNSRSTLLPRLLAAASSPSTSSRRHRPLISLGFASPPASRAPFFSSSSSSSSLPSSSAAAADLEGEGDDDDYIIYGNPNTLNSSSQAKAATFPTLLQPRVVIYDGVCHLCHRGVKWVIKADKYEKIKFCCLQSKAAEPYLRLCGVDREDVLRRFLFIEGPEAYYEGSTAALKVASYLPFPYSTLSSLLILPAPLRDAVYDYVAKRRYDWFGKDDECIIRKQDQELLDRFIDRDEIFGGSGGDYPFF